MTFLVALLVWILILGLVGALALYAIKQLPLAPPFKQIAIAILCLIGILLILGAFTGQFSIPGIPRRWP